MKRFHFDVHVQLQRWAMRKLLALGSVALAAAINPAWAQRPASFSTDAELNRWVEAAYQQELDRSPILRAYLGLPGPRNGWDDFSDNAADKVAAIAKVRLSEIQTRFADARLSPGGRLTKELFVYRLQEQLNRHSCRLNTYPLTHYEGIHAESIHILVGYHRVDSVKDAEDYVARLQTLPVVLEQISDGASRRASKGYHVPRFSLLRLQKDAESLAVELSKAQGDGNPLLDDFASKLEASTISGVDRSRLLTRASDTIRTTVAAAYSKLASTANKLRKTSPGDFGMWAQPDGKRCYAVMLHSHTSTDLGAQEIHELGKTELAKIHAELLSIARMTGSGGSVRELIDAVRSAPSSYYSDDEPGKAAYLEDAERYVREAEGASSHWFRKMPKASLEVRRVEAFREGSSGTAFYEPPAADGSRPGKFYVNQRSTKLLPKYQLEVLVHHEAIPGHHVQMALTFENASLPRFRRYDEYTAYSEGWGLYAEYFPKEYGFYKDPLNDVGRLALGLRRAARLTVDTGLHAKGWTREEAVQFMLANTADSESSIRDEVDRYIMIPGQATAYQVGMIELLRLRRQAMEALGARFDIRDFHDAVLRNGPMPLRILAEQIQLDVQKRVRE